MTEPIVSEQIFALLRNALWGKEIDSSLFPIGGTDWNAIIKFTTQQTINGLIADCIIRNAETLNPGKELLRTMAFKLSMIRQTNAMLNDRVAEVVGIMTEHNIPTVLLKGQGNARLYPQNDLRQCGDIDLYVGYDNIKRAYGIMKELPIDEEATENGAKHIHIVYKGTSVELHRKAETLPAIGANRRWQKWTIEQLTGDKLIKYDFNGTSVAIPSVEFNAVYVFNHLYHHFVTGGIGLRQFCDWAMILHNHCHEIDRERLIANLKQFDLYIVWQYFICILVEKFGLPEEEAPLYNPQNSYKMTYILPLVFNGGNFGHYRVKTQRPKGYFAGKLHSFRNVTKYTLSLRFISHRVMITTYLRYLYSGISAVILDKLYIERKY